jgi:hypothetical protein
MLDKEMANRLGPLVNNQELWGALKEHLNNLRNLELQGLAVATSELEMYRKQGKASSLANLMNLKEQAIEAKKRKEEK